MMWTKFAALVLALSSGAAARADVSWDLGPETTGVVSSAVNVDGIQRVVLSGGAGSCKAVAQDVQAVFNTSAVWRKERSEGHRRAGSRTIVFYQYADLSMSLPYSGGNSQYYSFDPFETMGFLFQMGKSLSCDRILPAGVTEWPWGAIIPNGSGSAIVPLGKKDGRSLYMESLSSYVTDIYYCSRALDASELDILREKLKALFAARRTEESQIFKNYQTLRESYCAEERPSPELVPDHSPAPAKFKRGAEPPVLDGKEQPTSEVNFSGKPPQPQSLKPPQLNQPPKMFNAPFLMPTQPGSLN